MVVSERDGGIAIPLSSIISRGSSTPFTDMDASSISMLMVSFCSKVSSAPSR